MLGQKSLQYVIRGVKYSLDGGEKKPMVPVGLKYSGRTIRTESDQRFFFAGPKINSLHVKYKFGGEKNNYGKYTHARFELLTS